MFKEHKMAKIQMKLAQEQKLYVFSEVVKCGSITEAANVLCMTQPAVSTIIRQLEEHFGIKLIEKNGKKIYLTPAAKMLNEEWNKLHIAIDNLHYEMNQLSNGVCGKIRIAIVSSAKYFVPQVMCNYMHQYPNVKFECDIKHRENILPSLEKGIYDLAILTNPISYTTLSKFYLGNNKLIFIAEPNHSLFKRKKVSLQQLANENFVIREQSALITQMLFDLFQSQQLSIKILLEIDSTEAIRQAVISGLAIALVPEICVALEIKHNIVRKLPVNDINLQNSWYIVCNKNFENINLIKNFIEYLKSQATQILY
jgi:DNA-binding transcriptional LysR family regulator